MHIPSDPVERRQWLIKVRGTLRSSMAARTATYDAWHSWYLFGGEGFGARYNKIGPSVALLSSYLYAPRSARFALDIGPTGDEMLVSRSEAAMGRLRALWIASGADREVAQAVLWSLVNGSSTYKLSWTPDGPHAQYVPAGDFAVWRDADESVDRQQAVLFRFSLDRDSVLRWLEAEGAPNLVLLEAASLAAGPTEDAPSGAVSIGAMNPIVWDGAAPAGKVGAANPFADLSTDYTPTSDSADIECEELWALDDKTGDYRIISIIGGQLVASDRANDGVAGKLPFIPIAPEPVPGYFWGQSLVSTLIPLQSWREKRMNQLDRLFTRQANPPGVFSGFMGGIQDEKFAAVMRRGGLLASSQTPAARVELLTPQINSMSFTEIEAIDAMFNEALGLTEAMQGQAVSGVRGGSQAKEVMNAGMGRLTRRMLAVESAVAAGAQYMMDMARVYDPTVLEDDTEGRFLMAQVPDSARVEVSSHSSSPLFAERAREQAEGLLRLQIIDGETYADLTDPPMLQTIKARLKRREAREKKMLKEAIAATPAKDRGGLFGKLFAGRAKQPST